MNNLLDKKYFPLFLLFACILSRILTAIYYVEDIDSLRFALSLHEFSLVKLQPHFPGYPIFCFIAKILYSFTENMGISFALIDKRRPKANQAVVANLVGDLKNKKVLIIDDMIDTAGTICNAADAAMDNGAISVTAIATHPVLSGPAVDRLMNSKIDKVIVCDTIEITDDKIFDKLEVISVANVFGEAIKRIIDGTSLSSMFREAKG